MYRKSQDQLGCVSKKLECFSSVLSQKVLQEELTSFTSTEDKAYRQSLRCLFQTLIHMDLISCHL